GSAPSAPSPFAPTRKVPLTTKPIRTATPVGNGYSDPKIGPEYTSTIAAAATGSHGFTAYGSLDATLVGYASSADGKFGVGELSGSPGVSRSCAGACGAAGC